jgi:hypothetical protein
MRKQLANVLLRHKTKVAGLFLAAATALVWAGMVRPAAADCTNGCNPGYCAYSVPGQPGYSCYGIGAEVCTFQGYRLRCSNTGGGACWVHQGSC